MGEISPGSSADKLIMLDDIDVCIKHLK